MILSTKTISTSSNDIQPKTLIQSNVNLISKSINTTIPPSSSDSEQILINNIFNTIVPTTPKANIKLYTDISISSSSHINISSIPHTTNNVLINIIWYIHVLNNNILNGNCNVVADCNIIYNGKVKIKPKIEVNTVGHNMLYAHTHKVGNIHVS
jgi:hypothetical protein